jgi:TolB-like protein/Tfp pilus assembly protein PilF
MAIWSSEIKELEKLYESFKGQLPDLEKELERLIKADDENMILLYSRRCLEVIITDLCECELKRPRKTEPLQGIIDKLHKERKVPDHIITSMHGLNELSTYGAHPKDFDPEQVKPVLNNLDIIIKWYLKYKDWQVTGIPKSEAKRHETEFSEAYTAEKSIAVLPFVDMSPAKDQDYFCDGITEEIINVLAHVENFKVIARTSAFAFKDKHVDIREIGRILNVETLLEGSIRKADNKLRIAAQLIKVADGSHIWSEHYDREVKDVFAIQDEISLAIADNLKIKLLGETKAMIARRHSENLEAFNLYLKGTHYWQMFTLKGYRKASEYFEQALQKDPKYTLAYIGFAAVKTMSTTFGDVAPNEAFPRAYEYANKALKIDSTLAEAYATLGDYYTFYLWNWKEAERNFKRALEINPNSSMIHIEYTIYLIVTGRYEEAVSEGKRAQELDPLSCYINNRAGDAFQYARQSDKAIETYQMTLKINPNYFLSHYQLGRVYYYAKGMVKESVAENKKAVALSDGNSMATASLITRYYQIGKKDQAEKLSENLKKRAETEYVPSTSFYLIYRVRGEEEMALKWLKKACDEHDTFLPYFRADPILIPEGSKYMELLKEMGLDY